MADKVGDYVTMSDVTAVTDRIKEASEKTDGTIVNLMDDLLGFSGVLSDMGTNLMGSVGSVSIKIEPPRAPVLTPPSPPSVFVPSPLSFPSAPTVVDADTLPNLELGKGPTPEFGPAPSPANPFTESTPGDVPSIFIPQLPGSPQLLTPAMAPLLGIEFGPFTGTAPTYSPSETMSPWFIGGLTEFTEPPPGEAERMLTEHRELLLKRIGDGGTGLAPAAEGAIWNRERDREAAIMRGAEEDVLRQDAALGFHTPSGTAQAKLFKVRADYSNKLIAFGRDIAIKQAQLEFDNTMKALEQLIPIEQEITKFDLTMRQRAFEAVKFNNEAAIQIYDVTMKGFLAAQEARKIGIQIYQAQIQAYDAEINAHTALISAESAKVTVNKALIDQYIAELSVNNMLLEAYKSEISATVASGELEGLKVKMFDSQISAYTAKVQAHVALLQGKTAETQAYSERVKAYQAEVQGYASGIDAKAKEFEALAAQNRVIMDNNRLNVEVFKAQVDAESSKAQAEIGFATANNQSNSVYASAIGAINNTQAQMWGTAVQAHISAQTVASQTAKMNLDAVQATKAMSLDASKVAAQTYAQLISSYLNQTNYGVNVTGSASIGADLKESHNFDETKVTTAAE